MTTTTPCSTNCANCVANWGAWSACSLSCGDAMLGTQSRVRVITTAQLGKGKPCSIPASDQRSGCLPVLPPCPVPCVIGMWSDWSACSGTCAPSQRKRVRTLVDAMFGAPACPPSFEIEMCANQSMCEGTILQTPFPTPPPLETLMPSPMPQLAATVQVFASDLAAQFRDGDHPQAATLPFELGRCLPVRAASSEAGASFFTASSASIGCQADGSGHAGLVKAPNGIRFEFKTRRAFSRIVLAGFVEGNSARLVGFDRSLGRRRAGEFEIVLVSSDSSLTNDGGFDTWELYPNDSAELGLQEFEIFSAIASLPTTTTALEGATNSNSGTPSVTDPIFEFEPSGEANDMVLIIVIVCVVVVLLILAAVFAVWFIRKRQSENDLSSTSFGDPEPYQYSSSSARIVQQAPGGTLPVGLEPVGNIQYSNIPHNYTEFDGSNIDYLKAPRTE